jgi:periplasmic divalent cation tolerance protein
MTDKVVVFVTAGSAEEGRRIGRALVEQELAACVNVTSPVRSLYHWKGQIADDEEVLLVIKTSRALFDRLRREVEKLHSYQVPEVIAARERPAPVETGTVKRRPRRRPRPRPVKTRKKK